MGVTIHFEGKLKRPEAYQAVLATARRFAESQNWSWEPIEEKVTTLKRIREEKDWDYVGPVKGVVLYPHENSEPVRLEFDSELYIQEYTKTQFAPIEVHLLLVELLKKIEPYFEQLIVFDWNSRGFRQGGDAMRPLLFALFAVVLTPCAIHPVNRPQNREEFKA